MRRGYYSSKPRVKIKGARSLHQAYGLRNASLVLVGTTEKSFADASRFVRAPRMPEGLKGELTHGRNVILLSPAATRTVQSQKDGVSVSLNYQTKIEAAHTYNAIGILPGSDPKLRSQAILLSAHLDHLGIGKPVSGRQHLQRGGRRCVRCDGSAGASGAQTYIASALSSHYTGGKINEESECLNRSSSASC